jgi:hypothetical protein
MNATREFVSKFAVFTNEQVSSSVWRAWKGRNNDNIYIAPRNLAGILKISLHKSRHCHLAFTSQYWKKEGPTGIARPAIFTWYRSETPDKRATVLASLLIAEEFLAPWTAPHDKFVQRLPSPGVGKAYKITFIFSRIPIEDLVDDKWLVLGQCNLISGEQFVIISALVDFDANRFFQTVSFNVPFDRHLVLTNVVDPGLRALVYSDPNETGELQLSDVGGPALAYLPPSS